MIPVLQKRMLGHRGVFSASHLFLLLGRQAWEKFKGQSRIPVVLRKQL